MFKAYGTMWKCALKFDGRTSRRYHNLAMLLHLMVCSIIVLPAMYLKLEYSVPYLANTAFLICLIMEFVAVFPMRVRRLHDIGSNGVFLIIAWIVTTCDSAFALLGVIVEANLIASIFAFIIGVSRIIYYFQFLFCVLFCSDSDGEQYGTYYYKDYGYFGKNKSAEDIRGYSMKFKPQQKHSKESSDESKNSETEISAAKEFEENSKNVK